MKLSYRADIDGLRAVAVLAVLFFHAGFSLLPGGYVGVDVFFVISGYLITAILRRELAEGRYSLRRFYERRARRILPALIVMSIVTVVLSSFFLLPSMSRDVPRQALSALGFVANIHFWLTSGYFSAAAETKPFLHTWSLGVEEQFYILMPLLMALVALRAARFQFAILSAAAALSLWLCVWLTPRYPEASFYLLPMRGWELLAGALLTYVPVRPRARIIDEGLAAAGLLLLLFAIFRFDAKTSFPGYHAIVPVVGAALLIHTAPGTLTGRLLSLRPMVGVGLISYSLYLWHWPVVVFILNGGVESDASITSLIIVILSLLLGYLSWRFIERPFRDTRRMPVRRLLSLCAAGALALVMVTGVFSLTKGNLGRFSEREIAIDRNRYDISPWRGRCHISSGVGREGGYCTLGEGRGKRLTVWADSHGVELSAVLAETGQEVTTITYSACPPAPGYVAERRPDCLAHNDHVMKQITAGEVPQRVVMAANYANYPSGMIASMVAAARELAAKGVEVVIVGPFPTPGFDVPTHLAFGRDPRFTFPLPEIYEQFAALPPSVKILDPGRLFCQGNECSMLVEGAPILFDDNHPSMKAARVMARELGALLPDLRGR